ncbi:MAG TPA: VIT1/CCC1 family protein [Anaeromyxobacteraceae bacterium]|nr:VIT1/CCC1 family protein [Anaeromyxobacteraceae bacterium]
MAERTDLWMENLQDERDGAALYEGLASLEKDPDRAESFRQLAEGERRHADIWRRKLEGQGAALPPDRASARVRALLWLARRLGTSAVLPLVAETEGNDAEKYQAQASEAESSALAEEEREHRAVLAGMGRGLPAEARATIASRERWHRSGRGGSLRAAIFGMNDGLVSNLSLVLGVAGAVHEPRTVLVTGFAGLLAGASSMAVGEYTSVASQRDVLARQVAMERREIAEAPEEEAAELALILQQKGLSAEEASRAATEILKKPDQALDTLVREELGLDPEDLGSPMQAAGSSFAMFAVGASVPVVPFLFAKGWSAVAASAALAGVVLAAVGAVVGFLSGTSMTRSAARMVGLAALAAGVTYAVGRLVGAAVG